REMIQSLSRLVIWMRSLNLPLGLSIQSLVDLRLLAIQFWIAGMGLARTARMFSRIAGTRLAYAVSSWIRTPFWSRIWYGRLVANRSNAPFVVLAVTTSRAGLVALASRRSVVGADSVTGIFASMTCPGGLVAMAV